MAVVAMQIFVNDDAFNIDEQSSVRDLLFLLKYHDSRGLAVAVNDAVFPRSGWSEQLLQEGDRVTLIRAAAGG